MLSAFGCSNMLLSKGGQQEESSRTIILERKLRDRLKDIKYDFIPGPAVYQFE